TYVALSRAMNHHDVGRARGGIAEALGRITADTTIAGVSTDRLYPLRLQHELAEVIRTAGPVDVIASIDGHDPVLTETQARGEVEPDATHTVVRCAHHHVQQSVAVREVDVAAYSSYRKITAPFERDTIHSVTHAPCGSPRGPRRRDASGRKPVVAAGPSSRS